MNYIKQPQSLKEFLTTSEIKDSWSRIIPDNAGWYRLRYSKESEYGRRWPWTPLRIGCICIGVGENVFGIIP